MPDSSSSSITHPTTATVRSTDARQPERHATLEPQFNRTPARLARRYDRPHTAPPTTDPSGPGPTRRATTTRGLRPGCILESSFKVNYTEAGGLGQPACRQAARWWRGYREVCKGWVGRGVFMTPIDRELLSSSVLSEGQMSLPAEAFTDDSVLDWEMEHFFDESWVC